MISYNFNVGDYAAHTHGLSLMEDLAFRRLLDLYYVTERAVKGSSLDVARRIGMPDHVEEVDFILISFFRKVGICWVIDRVESEIYKHASAVNK